jgi:16S rRNA (uracil1498-N3)-methyltransferase
MSRRRFYATPEDIDGAVISLSVDETRHLTRVLRLKPGAEVFVFDGHGSEYSCAFVGVEGDRARLEVTGVLDDAVESPVRITLAQALAKGEKFDLIVQKATELGVDFIVPLLTEHTDVKPGAEDAYKRIERWRRISLEALKQSGRRRLVGITAPLALDDFLDPNKPDSQKLPIATAPSLGSVLVFSEKGGLPITEALAQAIDKTAATILIGPEGGWGTAELELICERGCRLVTLGPRVLRTETAAIVAVTLVQHALGDLSRTVG